MRFSGFLMVLAAGVAAAQNVPAARQSMELSAFGGVTGVLTGIHPNVFAFPVTGGPGVVGSAEYAGRNLGITAGVDLRLRPFFGLSPGIEGRGTYAVDNGSVAGERDLLGGVTLSRRVRFLQVYGDLLAGRGEILYNPPFLDASGQFLYVKTISNVLSPGAGLDVDVSRHFAFKADVQYQRYAAPVPAGHVWSTPLTAGVVYRFDFNRAPGLPNR